MTTYKRRITESIAQSSVRYSLGLFGRFAPTGITNHISSIGFSINCIPENNLGKSYGLWHVAAPKTGGTWLSRMLQNMYPDHETKYFGNSVGTRQLNSMKVLFNSSFPFQNKSLFLQQHCINCRNTENFLEKSGCRTILQCRNIFDSIISLYDHSNLSSNDDFWTLFGYNNKIWDNLDENFKLDFLVDFAAPWYLKFYSSWFSSDIIKSDQIYVITYENLKNNAFDELKKVSEWYGSNISDNAINMVIDSSNITYTRKNKAIVGRGKESLNEGQIDRIYSLAKYYSSVDLSAIGIHS